MESAGERDRRLRTMFGRRVTVDVPHEEESDRLGRAGGSQPRCPRSECPGAAQADGAIEQPHRHRERKRAAETATGTDQGDKAVGRARPPEAAAFVTVPPGDGEFPGTPDDVVSLAPSSTLVASPRPKEESVGAALKETPSTGGERQPTDQAASPSVKATSPAAARPTPESPRMTPGGKSLARAWRLHALEDLQESSASDTPDDTAEPDPDGAERSPLVSTINLDQAMHGKVTRVTETLVVTKFQAGIVREERRRIRVYDVIFEADFKKDEMDA